jgi:hypothetical protein
MRKVLLIAATTLSLTLTPVVFAQSQAPAPASPAASGAATPAPAKLSEPQVVRGLERLGYTEIRTVQRNGDVLQMQAKKEGKPVTLMVDTTTGRAAASSR